MLMKPRLLIVEDNEDMRETLRAYMANEGYEVTAVPSTEEGIDVVDEQPIDIGLIDINLPGKSGYDMIEYIREQSDIPLIALTARDAVEDKVRGFDLGVHDYVVKPFDLRELSARMKSNLSRSSDSDEKADVKVGKYLIKPKSLSFSIDGKDIELTKLEFRMMHLLMLQAGNLVELDALINFAWGESEDLANPPIRIHIANLRKKIGDDDFKIIRTIPGTGYILNIEGA